MRLIDADEFFATVDYADTDVCEFDADGWCTNGYSTDTIKSLLLNAPTIDAVPVVRCKDCKFTCDEDDDGTVWCKNWNCYVGCEHFCAHGERKDGAE